MSSFTAVPCTRFLVSPVVGSLDPSAKLRESIVEQRRGSEFEITHGFGTGCIVTGCFLFSSAIIFPYITRRRRPDSLMQSVKLMVLDESNKTACFGVFGASWGTFLTLFTASRYSCLDTSSALPSAHSAPENHRGRMPSSLSEYINYLHRWDIPFWF